MLLFPARAFIKKAGESDIIPNTLLHNSSSHFVISASPPSITTSPTSVSQSASYLSAKSAYCADVDVACTMLALTSTNVGASNSVSPSDPLNAVQAPPEFPKVVVPSSANVSSHTQ